MMTTAEVNGVTLGVEHFGDVGAPLVLCAGGPTMLSWPGTLCESVARGGRHVARYDLRDCGESTTVDPDAPAYTLRDLAADAAALSRKLDSRPVHLAGIGVGGMVAQIAALDHPEEFSALTLIGTRPVAPGPVDTDLPGHDATTMDRLFSRGMPDWSDRDVGQYLNRHDLPYHPLWNEGYVSIGDVHTTRPLAAAGEIEATRFFGLKRE